MYMFFVINYNFFSHPPLLFLVDFILQGTAQRFSLLAGGRAWIMLIIVGNAEARKMLENAAESHQSSARGVGRVLFTRT